MHPVALIERLAATKLRRDKERILRDAFRAGCDDFFIGARLAYDPFVTFGLSKVAEIIEDDGKPGDLSFAEFLDLANRLHRRQLTDAREAIHAAAVRCDASTWNRFYRCILLKDLRVGIDGKLLNKALDGHPQFTVPLFQCQLPRRGAATQLRGCKLIDTVLDGVRALAVFDKETGAATLFNGNGQPIAALQTSLRRLLQHIPGSLVLDGMLHHDHLTLFDILPLADFRLGRCAKPQRERHAMLVVLQEAGLWAETEGMISVLPQIEVDFDSAAGRSACTEFARQALVAGHQAIMVKDPDAPYKGQRTTAWCKHMMTDFIEHQNAP